jgi:hypothetical protein
MDKHQVRQGILRSWHLANAVDLAGTFSMPEPLVVDESFRTIALSGTASYVELYLSGLRLSQYNFLLVDYSFFQFGWTAREHVRYAFYPNPFASRPDALEDVRRYEDDVRSGVLSYDDYLDILREFTPEPRVPLIRYDSAPTQYRELRHPACHFHIGHHADNRWAVRRLLTPLAFTALMVKHYYGGNWRRHGDDETAEGGNSLEASLLREKIDCRLIDPTRFSIVEDKSFFFC